MDNAKIDNSNVEIKDYKVKQTAAEYVLLFILSLLFLLLFSLWTSPYYKNWYGCDASFFSLVGRGITEGKVMYRDFYDLKGPYFFFIEAIGQFLSKGRFGVFLIQIAALYASVVLIWKISLLYVNKAKAWFIISVFFFCHICTLWGGNTLEEYFLPMSLLCLYLVCKLFKVSEDKGRLSIHKKVDIPTPVSLLLGLTFGLIIFSKITVSGTVIGIIAGLIFIFLADKRYKDLLFFILYVVLGMLIAALPVILYFSYHGCLSDMIDCVFVMGFRRSAPFSELFNITWELKCSGVIFALVFAALHIRRSRKNICIILIAMSSATYIFFHLGTPFYYYFTSAYPCIILALALFLEVYDPLLFFESKKQAICLVLFGIYLLYYIPASLPTIRTVYECQSDTSNDLYMQDSLELAKLIPPFERDSIFSFMIDMQFYEINNMYPDNRYAVNILLFKTINPQCTSELIDYFENDPPKWLVIGDDFEGCLPDMADIVNEKYSCIYENSVGRLYLHN